MPITAIPIPQFKLGKRKERSLMCEVFTDDGRWVDVELPALNSCVDYEQVGMTFLIDSDNQFLAEDNNWHQLITEKSMIPLCLRKKNIFEDGKNDKEELKKTSDDIFKTSFQQKLVDGINKAKQTEAWTKLIWIVSIVCGTVVIIAGMQYFRG